MLYNQDKVNLTKRTNAVMNVIERIETKITKECDVLVCGGGFAGLSAALAAARCGKEVILLDKGYMLGGLGTAGLVTIYLPLCNGKGQQVSFGIAEELFRLSISMGEEGRYPDNWLDSTDITKRTDKDKRFEVQFNPQIFALLAEQLLIKEGVKILYGTYAVAVDLKEGKIESVIIENKSGRQAIKVKSVVDASGDCDIAHFAGVETEDFKKGNALAAWYYSDGDSGYRLNMLGFCDIAEREKTEENRECLLSERKFQGLDGEELSEYMQMAHASILRDVMRRRNSENEVWPVTIATIPQIRMSRKIVGKYILDDSESHKYFSDSIGMISDWRKRGPVYEIPFRTLYSNQVENLITAGRCVSVTETMWDIMRVIPCCVVTGQAAGTAAAMSDNFCNLEISELQEELVKNHVVLHMNDLK